MSYRESSEKYPWLSSQRLDGKPFHFMMTNVRSENWFGSVESNRDYLNLISPGSRVIDCGANEGFTAVLAALKSGKNGAVLAIEPAEHNLQPLAINIELNGLSNVRVLPYALGTTDGEIEFEGEIVKPGSGSRVKSVTLNSLMDFRPDLIKIDIEGMEAKAIRGGMKLLQEFKPVLFLETHLGGDEGVDMRHFGDNPQELYDLLTGIGYEFYRNGGRVKEFENSACIGRHPQQPKRQLSTLIYSLAYGTEARNQAALMVNSLRGPGRYLGELRIYSDTDEPIEGATVIRNNDVSALPRPHLGKAFIGKSMDVTSFDRVMFLDADIVAVEPIAPFFQLSQLSAAVEMKIGLDDGRWFSMGPVAVGTPGFNSGTIVAPASQWNEFCQVWWNEMVERRVWESKTSIDQATLNHLGQTRAITLNPIPEGWVRFLHAHLNQRHRSKLIHMRGQDKLALMTCFMGMTVAAPPVTVADAADRCSILRLKLERLGEQPDVREEFRVMAAACDGIDGTSLYEINGKIWDLESDIRRGKEGELGLEEVGRRALAIRDLNAQRIAVKNSIAVRHGATTEIKGNHASQ